MKYFTFLGSGPYHVVDYYFEGEESNSTPITDEFVQYPIYLKHKDEISDIIMFGTDKSKDYLNQSDVNGIKSFEIFQFIQIPYEIETDSFIKILSSYIHNGDKFIIDVTNIFRNIPMKLLFALRYIELSKNASLEHLYYGMLNEGKEKVTIVDFLKDYRLQQVGELLSQFNRSLMLSSENIEPMLLNIDDVISKFLKSLSRFNEMIEFCEFDQSLTVMNQIIKNCDLVIENADKYPFIMPTVNKIKEKFNSYNKKKSVREKKKELINILIDHGRFQIAITFTDQYFREELIHYTFAPKEVNFDITNWKIDGKFVNKNSVYDYSQTLLLKFRINKWDSKNDYILKHVKSREAVINKNFNLLKNYKKRINDFYGNIRNHINHGSRIERKTDIVDHINTILKCVDLLAKEWK